MDRNYVAFPMRRRAGSTDDEPLLPGLIVYEPESEPRPIGILDVRGNMLHEVPRPISIGFIKTKG